MNIRTRQRDGVVVFDVEGEIRRSEVSDTTLHQLVKNQLESGRRKLLFNFAAVEFIDSFGVGEILASYISTQNLGGRLKIARISRKLHVVFQVTMLTKVLEIYDSEDEAFQSFGRT